MVERKGREGLEALGDDYLNSRARKGKSWLREGLEAFDDCLKFSCM